MHLYTCFDSFLPFVRKKFPRLGEVRSFIPPHVHMITLTVTATVSTRDKVITTLGMVDPYIPPHKPNIAYWVSEKKPLEITFAPLIDESRRKRHHIPRDTKDTMTVQHFTKIF